MTKNDLLKYCRYYNGEEQSPYEDCSNKSIFWEAEKTYVHNALRSKNFHSEWVKEAENYIKNSPNEENVLTNENVDINNKAIIIYVEVMLTKWCPHKVDIIFQY